MQGKIVKLLKENKNSNLRIEEIAMFLRVSKDELKEELLPLEKEGIIYHGKNDKYTLLSNTSLKVGSTYNKLTSSNIDTIKYDGLDIKNEVVALNVQIADITKDGAPLSAELISSSAGTATVKYKVTFSYKNTNITKTFTQTVNVTN